jgi:hypothetical protein
MAHFAELDVHHVVLRVIVVSDADAVDGETFCTNLLGGQWKQTSYNTRGGVHRNPSTNLPDDGTPFRKNYAGIGYTYDVSRDAFIPPKPFASWVLVEETCDWDAPFPAPVAPEGYYASWNESTVDWIFLPVPPSLVP